MGPEPGVFRRRLKVPERRVGKASVDVGRRMIGDPLPEAGVLAVGGGEVVG